MMGVIFCIAEEEEEEEEEELKIPYGYIDEQVSIMVKEMERGLVRFRGNNKYNLNHKTVLLVDDGIVTGATMFAAVQWIRGQNPKELIVAVPVAPKDIMNKLGQMPDKVVIVVPTSFCYGDIGEFYYDFIEVSDREVEDIMRKHLRGCMRYISLTISIK
jgi:putative phosphoribosyl transferase